MGNKILPEMRKMLAKWEVCMLKPYTDTDHSIRIGYGHGNANNFPPFVDENTVLANEEEAMAILVGELEQFYAPQLDRVLNTAGIILNDYQYNACLDIVYNRGIGTFRKSKCFDWLRQKDEKNRFAHAAEAMVNSYIDGFAPLNVAKDRVTGIERVYLGLTCRRIDDAAMFQTII